MFDLYIGNKNYSSWSLRPWALMRELEVPFREIVVPFGGAGNPDAFRAFSPTGKVPCLVDGEITVWDSMAITEYVAGGTRSRTTPSVKDIPGRMSRLMFYTSRTSTELSPRATRPSRAIPTMVRSYRSDSLKNPSGAWATTAPSA